jgi:hypothetical protein
MVATDIERFILSLGKVAIVIGCLWIEPKTDCKEEDEAAERALQMHVSSCWV